MIIEILSIQYEEDSPTIIAGAIITEKEIMDPLDPDNERIYFTEQEQQIIMSKPEDQRINYAKQLAESKRNG
jgi:hypothetical protein